MNSIQTIPYRGTGRLVLAFVFLLVMGVAMFQLAATNHKRLTLDGIPFSVSQATDIYWALFVITVLSTIWMTLELGYVLVFRPSIQLTDTAITIPGGALRSTKTIPYNTITRLNEQVKKRRDRVILTQLVIQAGGRNTNINKARLRPEEYEQLKRLLAGKMAQGPRFGR